MPFPKWGGMEKNRGEEELKGDRWGSIMGRVM
jgi:hypothetical protein